MNKTFNKTQLKDHIVHAMTHNDDRIVFNHFNNRRYTFTLKTDNPTIRQQIHLLVYLSKRHIVATYTSTSVLNETTYAQDTYPFFDCFLKRRTQKFTPFNPDYEVLIRYAIQTLKAEMAAIFNPHYASENLLRLKTAAKSGAMLHFLISP